MRLTIKAKGNNVNCNLQSRKKSFIEDSVDVMGSHPSTVARHIKITLELTSEAKEILRGAEKPVSSSVLKKVSKLPSEQQAEASSLLVPGKIKTVDEFLAKLPDADTTSKQISHENKSLANLPPEQSAAIMGMAYLADEVNSHVRDFLRQEETFSTLSRYNIRYIMEMLSSMRQSLDYFRDMLVDCY